MFKEASLELTGNERFEGFGIDLIHELSLILGFKYEFRLQEDGKYGNKNNVTKEWDGMIGQLRAGVRFESNEKKKQKIYSISFNYLDCSFGNY